MTRTDALHAVMHSHKNSKINAQAVTAAHYRYLVRRPDGTALTDSSGKVIETDDLSYALAARLACPTVQIDGISISGVVVDRWNWRNN